MEYIEKLRSIVWTAVAISTANYFFRFCFADKREPQYHQYFDLFCTNSEAWMKPDAINCYHSAEEFICALTSSNPPAAPRGHVKHGFWVSTWQNHRCLVAITQEVHQHLMTARIIKSGHVNSPADRHLSSFTARV